MNVCSFDVDIRILQRKRTSRVCGERGGERDGDLRNWLLWSQRLALLKSEK